MRSTTKPQSKSNPIRRILSINTSGEKAGRSLSLGRQLVLQLICLAITAAVLFPIMYLVTLAFSSSPDRPSALDLFPRRSRWWRSSRC